MINFKLSNQQLGELEKALGDSKNKLGKMAARAINKAAAKHKTQISKKLRSFVKVKVKAVNEYVTIPLKAHSPNQLRASIYVNQSKKMALNLFGAKQNKTGVRYQISKTEKGFIKGGFIVESFNGHVFERKNKYDPKATRKENRLMTNALRGTTMFNVYKKHKLGKWSKKEVAKEIKFQLDQQIKYAFEKQGK
jgi:hypothetical protein